MIPYPAVVKAKNPYKNRVGFNNSVCSSPNPTMELTNIRLLLPRDTRLNHMAYLEKKTLHLAYTHVWDYGGVLQACFRMIRNPLQSRIRIIPNQWNSANPSMERRPNQLLIEAQECPRGLFISPISRNTRHYHDQDERAKIYGHMPNCQHELLSGS